MKSRATCPGVLATGLVLVTVLLSGCKEATPNYCQKSGDCTAGRVCDLVQSVCVVADGGLVTLDTGADLESGMDAAADIPSAGEAGQPDSAEPIDLPEPPVDTAVDTTVPDGAGTCGTNGDCTDPTKAFCVRGLCLGCQTAGPGVCAPATPACDSASGRCVECTTDGQCTTDPAKGFCVANACTGCNTPGTTGCAARSDGKTLCAPLGDKAAGRCVECTTDGQCGKDPARAFCVANACTGCNTVGASGCSTRADGKIVCAPIGNSSVGQCVECAADAHCGKDPAKAFCVSDACAGCNTIGATGCTGRTDGKIVCGATSSSATDQCVECNVDADCKQSASKAFCVANACTGCTNPAATGCAARTDGKTSCSSAGTLAGQCVECNGDADCKQSASKGFCVANACTGCNTAGATGCAARTDGKTVCAASGAVVGQCVVCVASADCKVSVQPICDAANQCVACKADSECVAKLGATGTPGVCLANIDGHCATDAETVYVGTMGSATCSDGATNAGSAQAPYCSVQAGVVAAKSKGKSLAVLTGPLTGGFTGIALTAPLSVVGKNAVITPALASDGIGINTGELYLRGLTVQGTASTGIGVAAQPAPGTTVTLHMDTCKVTNNPGGGILLNGVEFDIRNTSVSGNGPGTTGIATWGGILVQNLPTTGLMKLNLVTIENNLAPGLSCAGTIQGSGVLATGNTLSQIGTTCGISACTPASATCGAQ